MLLEPGMVWTWMNLTDRQWQFTTVPRAARSAWILQLSSLWSPSSSLRTDSVWETLHLRHGSMAVMLRASSVPSPRGKSPCFFLSLTIFSSLVRAQTVGSYSWYLQHCFLGLLKLFSLLLFSAPTEAIPLLAPMTLGCTDPRTCYSPLSPLSHCQDCHLSEFSILLLHRGK